MFWQPQHPAGAARSLSLRTTGAFTRLTCQAKSCGAKVMDEAQNKPGLDVIYDGQCRFCKRSLAALERLARRRRVFRLHDANDRELIRSKFPMLADADTDAAMFAVT